MKKILCLFLTVLFLLPMVLSCGSSPEGTPVEIPDVKVVSFQNAYTEKEDGKKVLDRTLGTEIYAGAVTAYVAEGATLSLKDVVDGYVRDLDNSAVYDEITQRYTKIASLSTEDGGFWTYYINGRESSLHTAVKPTDAIEIAFELN